jgi:hypothetical protein
MKRTRMVILTGVMDKGQKKHGAQSDADKESGQGECGFKEKALEAVELPIWGSHELPANP